MGVLVWFFVVEVLGFFCLRFYCLVVGFLMLGFICNLTLGVLCVCLGFLLWVLISLILVVWSFLNPIWLGLIFDF